MRVRTETVVAVHRHGVKLLEGSHRAEQEDHEPAALHRLDSPRQQVGRHRLEVLEHQHAKGLAEDFVRVAIVAPPNVGLRHEEVEGVVRGGVVRPPRLRLLNLSHALLAVRREAQLKGGAEKTHNTNRIRHSLRAYIPSAR